MPTLISIAMITCVKIFVAKGGQLPTHEMMRITYSKERNQPTFQMTKIEVDTVLTMPARAILTRVMLNPLSPIAPVCAQ